MYLLLYFSIFLVLAGKVDSIRIIFNQIFHCACTAPLLLFITKKTISWKGQRHRDFATFWSKLEKTALKSFINKMFLGQQDEYFKCIIWGRATRNKLNITSFKWFLQDTTAVELEKDGPTFSSCNPFPSGPLTPTGAYWRLLTPFGNLSFDKDGWQSSKLSTLERFFWDYV